MKGKFKKRFLDKIIMIQEDYIIKIIKKAMEFISKALGLAKEGDYLLSENILKDSYEDITGINLNMLMSLDIDSMNDLLGNNAAEIIVTSEYLKALGKVYKEKIDREEFVRYYKKGLYFLLSNYKRDIYEINVNILLFYSQVKDYMDDVKYMKYMYEFFMDRVAYKKALEVIYMMIDITDNSYDIRKLGNEFFTEVLISNEDTMKKAKWTYKEALKSKQDFEQMS